jgi:hypothetical protein
VTLGVTARVAPVTVPTPWSMTSESAPVTFQDRMEVPPGPTVVGVALKDAMTGFATEMQTPEAQTWPAAPQDVPFGWFPVDEQVAVAVAVAQVVTPVTQGLVGWQSWFATQTGRQAPLAHTSPVPHAVPSVTLPTLTHVPGFVSEIQASAPVLHGSAGSHAVPATHVGATQAPPLQTFPPGHSVRSGLGPVTVQLGWAVADEQEVVPTVQKFEGWQACFATHGATQVPALHTLLPPQPVPSATFSPVSPQTELPVVQVVLPWWHGSAATQTSPSVQFVCWTTPPPSLPHEDITAAASSAPSAD